MHSDAIQAELSVSDTNRNLLPYATEFIHRFKSSSNLVVVSDRAQLRMNSSIRAVIPSFEASTGLRSFVPLSLRVPPPSIGRVTQRNDFSRWFDNDRIVDRPVTALVGQHTRGFCTVL